MKTYGNLKDGDVVYALKFDKYNVSRIVYLPIRNLREHSEHKVQFEVYNSSIGGFQTCVMEKNRRWGVFSPSIEGLQMYWKRELKRVFRRYKKSHNEQVD